MRRLARAALPAALALTGCSSRDSSAERPGAGAVTGGTLGMGGVTSPAAGASASSSGGTNTATAGSGGAAAEGCSERAPGGSAGSGFAPGASGASSGGGPVSGGSPSMTQPAIDACDDDSDCFANPPDEPSWARCVSSQQCECYRGLVRNPQTGRCELLPGSHRFTVPSPVHLLEAAGLSNEGALLLVEGIDEPCSGVGAARAVLQAVDRDGAPKGDRVVLSAPEQIIRLAIAADGARYLYCANSQVEVVCGLFEPPLTHSPRIFEAEGQSVAVAYTQDTWVVAYRTLQADPQNPEPVELKLQAFSRDGKPQGTALSLETQGPEPLLTGTGSEFVLVAPYAEREFRTHVFWLSPKLATLRPPAELTDEARVATRVAATPALVAVSSAYPYHSALSLVAPNSFARTHLFEGGDKLGAQHALTATTDSIVASWYAPDPRLVVASFASPEDPPPELRAEDVPWVTFRAGERVLGARNLGSFATGAELEVVPMPGSFQ